MKVGKLVNPKEYDVGVVVARFQVDDLHEQHKEFMDFIFSQHYKVIVFLGSPRTLPTRRNAMDFATRQTMIQRLYPRAIILPLTDNRKNSVWARELDNEIRKVFPNSKPLLYGSKDSFIPYYIDGKGKHTTTELVSNDYSTSGTDQRQKISREVLDSSKFRRGIIYATYARPAITFPTVDICSHDGDGNILLAKKPSEDKYRFIGGFVDATDSSYENAARREYREETTGEINNLKYILSQQVDDWRYQREVDGIMTTLFLAYHFMGPAKADDDIEEVKWFPVSEFTNPEVIKRRIMPEHQDMLAKLIQKIYEEQLIPNLGEFYRPKNERIDPDVLRPSEFGIKL